MSGWIKISFMPCFTHFSNAYNACCICFCILLDAQLSAENDGKIPNQALKQTNMCAFAHKLEKFIENLCEHQSQSCYSGWIQATAAMIYLSVWLWLWLGDHLYEWWLRFAMKMIISSFITSLKLWFTFFRRTIRLLCRANILNALHCSVHIVYLLLRCFYETWTNITINTHTYTKHGIGLENSSQ